MSSYYVGRPNKPRKQDYSEGPSFEMNGGRAADPLRLFGMQTII